MILLVSLVYNFHPLENSLTIVQGWGIEISDEGGWHKVEGLDTHILYETAPKLHDMTKFSQKSQMLGGAAALLALKFRHPCCKRTYTLFGPTQHGWDLWFSLRVAEQFDQHTIHI